MAARTTVTEIATVLVEDSDTDDVDAWLADTLGDGLGFSQADVAGFNLKILYDDSRVQLWVDVPE